jgi:hypothetical protein
MKKLISIVLLAMFTLFSGAAFADGTGVTQNINDVVKDKLSIGVQYDYTQADLEGDGIVPDRDYETQSVLVKTGYKLSDYLTPYVLLGGTGVREEADGFVYETDNDFTWGFGATGKLLDLPKGAVLSYDVNRLAFDSENEDEFKVATSKWSTSLIVSKVCLITQNEIPGVQSVTPYIGYKYTNLSQKSDMDFSETIALDDNLHSCVFGSTFALTDAVSTTIGGTLGQEKGFNVNLAYRF